MKSVLLNTAIELLAISAFIAPVALVFYLYSTFTSAAEVITIVLGAFLVLLFCHNLGEDILKKKE